MKLCKVCGRRAESDYCFQHKPRKAIQSKKKLDGNANVNDMWNFFLVIWKKRKHISEVSGKYLGNEPLSIYFHHILEKAKYPQYAFDPENIVLITWEEHTNLHSDMYCYEEVNQRRNQLKIKYNL